MEIQKSKALSDVQQFRYEFIAVVWQRGRCGESQYLCDG